MSSAALATSLAGRAGAIAGSVEEAAARAGELKGLSELSPPPQADKKVVVSSRGIIIFFIACIVRSISTD